MTMKEGGNPDPSLNEYQLRALLVSCQHIDKLLGEIEGLLNSSRSGLAFPKYFDDLSSAQHNLIDDYIRRTRADLLQAAAEQGRFAGCNPLAQGVKFFLSIENSRHPGTHSNCFHYGASR